MEQARQDTQIVEKVMNGKFIKVGEQRVAYSYRAQVRWTDYGNSRYSSEQRGMGSCFAENE
eukprot:12428771-Karenia_brevis.AAC.1